MKYLLIVMFIGCLVLVCDNSYTHAGDTCTEQFIYDCFDPTTYKKPGTSINYDTYTMCKTWTSTTINCPGTYYMAVYVDLPPGKILTYVAYESTCPGNISVEPQSGDQIENILKTYTTEQLAQLSADEIRQGKTPVFIRFKCYENGQGKVTFRVHCDFDRSGSVSIFDTCEAMRFLLLGDRKK